MQWEKIIVKHLKSNTIHPKFKKLYSFKIVIKMDIGINRNFRINIIINKLDKKRYKNCLIIMFIKRKLTQQNLQNLKAI